MANTTALLGGEAIRGAFQQWHAEQEPLDAQLSESLAALTAYQSHLDAWQQQLARDRDELRAAREQLDRDAAAAEQARTESNTQLNAELAASREKISTLTAALLARTEELRTSDSRRAEAVTELELARALEKELHTALEESKRAREQERLQLTEELRHLREILEHRVSEAKSARELSAMDEAARTPTDGRANADTVQPPAGKTTDGGGDDAVFGSILQQFGKLRQQRAMERPAIKKAR